MSAQEFRKLVDLVESIQQTVESAKEHRNLKKVKNNIGDQDGNKGIIDKWYDPNWESNHSWNVIEKALEGVPSNQYSKDLAELIFNEIIKNIDQEIDSAKVASREPHELLPTQNILKFFSQTMPQQITPQMKQIATQKIAELRQAINEVPDRAHERYTPEKMADYLRTVNFTDRYKNMSDEELLAAGKALADQILRDDFGIK
jgi:hypothetical protein